MGTKLRSYLCTYQGCGHNFSLTEVRGTRDQRRGTRDGDPESVAAPSEAIDHRLGESSTSTQYLHFDNTRRRNTFCECDAYQLVWPKRSL